MRPAWRATALASVIGISVVTPTQALAVRHGMVPTVNERGNATLPSGVRALTGSADFVVYERTDAEVLGTKAGRHQRAFVYSHLPHQLVARATDGTTVDLGLKPPASRFWSMVGGLVTAEHLRSGDIHRPVLWWDVVTGHHGSIEVPDGFFYSSAAPDGAIITNPSTHAIELLHRNGSVTDLGTGGASFLPMTVSSDSGFVNWDGSGGLTYQTWSSPGSFVDLQSGLGQLPNQPRCAAMSDTYVACAASGQISLVPLDGGAPVISATADVDYSGLGIIGTALLYRDYDSKLHVHHGGGNVETVTVKGVGALVETDGGVVTEVQGKRDQLFTVDTEAHFSSITGSVPSRIVTGAFAVTPHAIRWIDDAPTPHHPRAIVAVRSRRYSLHGGVVRLGKTANVDVLPGGLHDSGLPIAAAGPVTAFQQTAHHVEAMTPRGRTIFHHTLTAADSRWVVTRSLDSASAHDLRTGRTVKMRSHDLDSFAVWHNDLAHLASNGKVTVTNLATGHRRLVRPKAPRGKNFFAGPIYIKGDRVAWYGDSSGRARSHLVNLRSGERRRLSHYVIGITAHGVLEAVFQLSGGSSTRPPLATIWYQPDGGAARVLYDARRWWRLPEVAGHVIAWINEAGQLKARRFHPPPA